MPVVSEIEIRDFQDLSDYDQCVRLQIEVWAISEAATTPVAELVTSHRYGGVCIGAFDRDHMVGFVCGMVGREGDQVFHHSNMLGVVPAQQGRGIGEKLKWAQYDRVRDQGMNLINWTFDPLQAPNANFNINRLGVVIRKYIVNMYGEVGSPLHGGLPTDRLEAEWWLDSPRVRRARQGEVPDRPGWETLPRVNLAQERRELLWCEEPELGRRESALLLEIPLDVTSMMAQDRELALDWRLKTRRTFQTYFDRGYAVVGFHRSDRRTYYRLEKG